MRDDMSLIGRFCTNLMLTKEKCVTTTRRRHFREKIRANSFLFYPSLSLALSLSSLFINDLRQRERQRENASLKCCYFLPMIFLLSWRVDLQLFIQVIYLQLDRTKVQLSHLFEFLRLALLAFLADPSTHPKHTDTIDGVTSRQLLLVKRLLGLELIGERYIFETKPKK